MDQPVSFGMNRLEFLCVSAGISALFLSQRGVEARRRDPKLKGLYSGTISFESGTQRNLSLTISKQNKKGVIKGSFTDGVFGGNVAGKIMGRGTKILIAGNVGSGNRVAFLGQILDDGSHIFGSFEIRDQEDNIVARGSFDVQQNPTK